MSACERQPDMSAPIAESERGAEKMPACVDCGEERGSCPDGRCRDCDLSFISSWTTCRECLSAIWREEVCGPRETQHAATCSLKASTDYGPRTDDERWAIREARFGERPPQGVDMDAHVTTELGFPIEGTVTEQTPPAVSPLEAAWAEADRIYAELCTLREACRAATREQRAKRAEWNAAYEAAWNIGQRQAKAQS